MESQDINHVIQAMLRRRAFPELAVALRPQIKHIVSDWETVVRELLSCTRGLRTGELRNRVPSILADIADMLAEPSEEKTGRVMRSSPAHGLARYNQHFHLWELLAEDVLLRQLILEKTGWQLHRPMTTGENVMLNLAIDAALQRAADAFDRRQNEEARTATESERKHLTLLSHDLSNNLSAITLWLEIMKERLGRSAEFSDELSALAAAQLAVTRTRQGMERLITLERLRQHSRDLDLGPVNLHRLIGIIAAQHRLQAARKRVNIRTETPADAVARSDELLLSLILQNLLGNAVKYTERGSVRVVASARGDQWVISVSDQGPGIAKEHLRQIFVAFQRGETRGQEGVGLGLAIASEAAEVLGAGLSVESTLGVGSKFDLTLPAAQAGDAS